MGLPFQLLADGPLYGVCVYGVCVQAREREGGRTCSGA